MDFFDTSLGHWACAVGQSASRVQGPWCLSFIHFDVFRELVTRPMKKTTQVAHLSLFRKESAVILLSFRWYNASAAFCVVVSRICACSFRQISLGHRSFLCPLFQGLQGYWAMGQDYFCCILQMCRPFQPNVTWVLLPAVKRCLSCLSRWSRLPYGAASLVWCAPRGNHHSASFASDGTLFQTSATCPS